MNFSDIKVEDKTITKVVRYITIDGVDVPFYEFYDLLDEMEGGDKYLDSWLVRDKKYEQVLINRKLARKNTGGSLGVGDKKIIRKYMDFLAETEQNILLKGKVSNGNK